MTIAPNPALSDKCLYGGYLVLAPQGGGAAMRVPFAGFKGDFQALQVLTPTANGFPWLAKRTGGVFTKQPRGRHLHPAGGRRFFHHRPPRPPSAGAW